jgi:lipopolysaccharide export system protein LptA
MFSDSVAWYEDRAQADMVGRVNFNDSTVRLEAQRAVYFMRDDRLEAYGQVRLTNLRTGTVLTGPNLTYFRRTALRDTTELRATQRPRVEYRAEGDSAGAEPYVINGDRIRFKGNSLAWSAGSVTVDRSDLSARSDSARLDLGGGTGDFVGHAEVKGRGESGYTLAGRTVTYRQEDGELRWVQARENAEATSAEWRLVADTIEFDLADRQIQGGRAWGGTPRPRAASLAYTISADSIALDAPAQRLKEVRGFGHGHAESRNDSARAEPDWMAGDTLVAHFDSTAFGTTALSRLVARGNARALYRVPDPARPGGPPGITYSRGTHIAARFTPVGLERVDVIGKGDGLYLEPAVAPAVPAAPADTAQ